MKYRQSRRQLLQAIPFAWLFLSAKEIFGKSIYLKPDFYFANMSGVDKTIVSTDKAPKAIGPYSQAIKANGFLFVSGQIPLDPKSGEIVGKTIEEQTQQVLKNLGAILEAGGSNFANVVKTGVYLTDLNDFKTMNETYAKVFTSNPPARATVEVKALPKGVKVEIDAVALV